MGAKVLAFLRGLRLWEVFGGLSLGLLAILRFRSNQVSKLEGQVLDAKAKGEDQVTDEKLKTLEEKKNEADKAFDRFRTTDK